MERCLLSSRYCFIETHKILKNIDNVNVSILDEWFQFTLETTPIKIDSIIYLKTTPKNWIHRIKQRNRQEEKKIDHLYFETLHTRYENWLKHKNFPIPSPIIIINADQDQDQHSILKELNCKI